MLGNDADALDAAQEAFLAAVRALDRFDGRSTFGTWMYRIATNACIDELRRRRRRPVTGLDTSGESVAGNQGFDVLAAKGPRSATAWAGRDPADVAATWGDVDAALRSLPVEFRTAVVLRDVCDLPYEEIAHILRVPMGTVRSRIARGRAGLAAGWSTGDRVPDPSAGLAGNPNLPLDVQATSANEGELTP
jgi:RNA polymerase sigma-70 factor (ECF subfamily)